MKTKTLWRLEPNVIMPMAERRCPFCKVEYSTTFFSPRRTCGSCPSL